MKRRIISFLLSFAIAFVFILPTNVLAAEENIKKYCGSGYEITYDIKSRWTGNQNVEVTIKNTGTESLLNWALKYDAHGELNGLWNGTVFSSDSTKYIVKNAGYNYEILPEQSVTFGYTLSGEYMEFPETIELCSQRTERDADKYNVTMDVTSEWGNGFIGTVTIENIGDSVLEAWRLSFNTNFDITDIWNVQIFSSTENSYTVATDITTTPIGVGESKTFGFKATKESGVTPEITDFVMSEVTINDDFTTIDIPQIALVVSGFANYIEDENALNIFWYTNIENGRFELLESYNNEDFITTIILNDKYSYTYPIAMDFDKRYFKVIQTSDDGQTAESPVFYVEKTEDGYLSKFVDSDEDGLPDFVEEQIGTDINNEDTDGDGLTDYQEYHIFGTDPLVYDSVTEGVSDADADCDDDGLSNSREFDLETKPFNPDTDNDGLTDGDEVNIYGTDPLKYDTDDDGISDGDEVALGTDPLSPTTDGIADTERTFVQTIDADDEILEDINTEYNPYDLSLEITAAGNAHSSLAVQESGYSDSMFNQSVLGTCLELIYDDSCKVDEVVLKFKVGEEYIDNSDSENAKVNSEFVGIKRYNVFRFFEEDNILLPVETDVDVENNTVSANVSDLGTYCLIDMEMFFENISSDTESSDMNKTTNDIEVPSGGQPTAMLAAGSINMIKSTATSDTSKVKPKLDYDDEFNVVFMYDTGAEGYSDFYDSVCDTTDFIFNKSVNANVYFVELKEPSCDMSYFARRESPAAGYVDKDKYDFHDSFLRNRNFTDHTSSSQSKSIVVSDALDFVVNGIRDGDDNFTEIVDTSLPTLCFSFFSDENSVYRESTGYQLLGDLVSKNVFVNLVGNYDFSTYVGGYAKDLYQKTGGKYFRFDTTTSNISDELIKYIYNTENIEQVEYQYNMILSCGLSKVNLDGPIDIGAYNASKIITKKNHDSSKFSKFADTDGDGLYDFEEVNFSSNLIKIKDGQLVLPTFGECIDYYGIQEGKYYVSGGLDRFTDGFNEQYSENDLEEYLKYNFDDLIILPIISNPVAINSDGDEVDDFYDIEPLLGVNEWSNCLVNDETDYFNGVENHCLIPIMIDEIEYYKCMNCDIEPIISPDYQELYYPESLNLTNEDFAMLSVLRYLYLELTTQGKLEEAEIVYRIMDKIRTRNSLQHYRYHNLNGHYISPMNYLLIYENNDYCADFRLYNVYNEVQEEMVKEIESDILGMISLTVPLPETLSYFMTTSNTFTSIAEKMMSHDYFGAIKTTSKTISSEILKQEKLKLNGKLSNGKDLSDFEKSKLTEKIKGIDDVQNLRKTVSAFKYVRKYALPFLAQGSFIFNNYQFNENPAYTINPNMYYATIDLRNMDGGNVYMILYDCSINSNGESDIYIHGMECSDGFANSGHFTNKLTVESNSIKWDSGIIGNNWTVNEF